MSNNKTNKIIGKKTICLALTEDMVADLDLMVALKNEERRYIKIDRSVLIRDVLTTYLEANHAKIHP